MPDIYNDKGRRQWVRRRAGVNKKSAAYYKIERFNGGIINAGYIVDA